MLLAAAAGVPAGLFVLAAVRKGKKARRLDDAWPDGWPVNMAHRGASARAPENTLEAFRLAAACGAGGLETDIHMTRDGRIVAIHDNTVDRTTDGSGRVREMTLREIQSLDAGYRFTPDGGATYPYRGRGLHVPEFGKVLREFPDLRVNVDIKEEQAGVEGALLGVIREAGAEELMLVVSEWTSVIERFRELSGGRVRTGASGGEIRTFHRLQVLRLEGLLRPAYERLQVPAHHRGQEVVTRRLVEAAHEMGLRVDVWTIDEPREMRRLLDLGADVIMTNRPGDLAEVLRNRRRDPEGEG